MHAFTDTHTEKDSNEIQHIRDRGRSREVDGGWIEFRSTEEWSQEKAELPQDLAGLNRPAQHKHTQAHTQHWGTTTTCTIMPGKRWHVLAHIYVPALLLIPSAQFCDTAQGPGDHVSLMPYWWGQREGGVRLIRSCSQISGWMMITNPPNVNREKQDKYSSQINWMGMWSRVTTERNLPGDGISQN